MHKLKKIWLVAVALAAVVVVVMATDYTFTGGGFQNINVTVPTGSEAGSAWAPALRQLKAACVSFATLEHDLTGHHQNGFLTTAMIGTGVVTLVNLEPAVQTILAGAVSQTALATAISNLQQGGGSGTNGGSSNRLAPIVSLLYSSIASTVTVPYVEGGNTNSGVFYSIPIPTNSLTAFQFTFTMPNFHINDVDCFVHFEIYYNTFLLTNFYWNWPGQLDQGHTFTGFTCSVSSPTNCLPQGGTILFTGGQHNYAISSSGSLVLTNLTLIGTQNWQ